MPSSQPKRRTLLLGGIGLAATLAGCRFDDPTVTPRAGAGAAPSASPTSDATVVAAQKAEDAMATWLAGLPLVQAAGAPIPAGMVVVLTALRDAHRAHATLLGQSDPLSPVAGTPTAVAVAPKVPGTWDALVGELTTRQTALAASHRTACLAATDPSHALLFASLHAFATTQKSLTLAVTKGSVQPAHVQVGNRLDALGVLLGHVRALAQGLQIGAGQLPLPSPLYTPARTRLAAVWTVRDSLEKSILAAGGTITPAPASYRMPGGFSTPAEIQKTWGALETTVLNGWARLAAASTGNDRAAALDAMAPQAAAVQATGTSLTWWPGWA